MFGLTKLIFLVARKHKKAITLDKVGWTNKLFPNGQIYSNHYYKVWETLQELHTVTFQRDRNTHIKVFNTTFYTDGKVTVGLTKEIKPYLDEILAS